MLALVTAVAVTAYAASTPVPIAGTASVDQSAVTGWLSVFGILVAALFSLFWLVLKIFDSRFTERMTIYMADDALPFGRHRVDPNAHTQLRKEMEASFKVELRDLHSDVQAMEDRHHATMQALIQLMQPLIEQNAEAMKIARANMRRQPGDTGSNS